MVKKILPGDVIGTVECEGCKHEIDLKVNKNGCVYTYCNRIVGTSPDGKAEKCFTRFTLGRKASREIITELEKSERVEQNAGQVEIEEIGNACTGAADECSREGGVGERADRPGQSTADDSGKQSGGWFSTAFD